MTTNKQFDESWAKTGLSKKDRMYVFARSWFMFGVTAGQAEHRVILNKELEKCEELFKVDRAYSYVSGGYLLTEGVVDGLEAAIRLIANEPEKK